MASAFLCGLVLSGGGWAAEGTVVYKIGAQDELQIQITNTGEPSVQVRVTPDGYVLFPELGRVAAAGKTPEEFAEYLRAKLADGYYVKPEVAVAVTAYNSKKVLVIGEARTPGEIAAVGNLTLIELITKVGGPTGESDGRLAVSRPTKLDIREKHQFDIREIMAGSKEGGFLIHPGDLVLFSRRKTDYVYVTGEVTKRGVLPITEAMTVQQALVAAGGLTEIGSERKIYLYRVRDGKETRMKAKTTDLVQDGDTIVVKQGWF